MNSEKRKGFYEYFALGVLAAYDSSYGSMQKLEEPDLQSLDKSLGVEITMLNFDSEKHASDLLGKYREATIEEEKNKLLGKLQDLNRDIKFVSDKPSLIKGGGYNGCKEQFVGLLNKKLEKLKSYKNNCRNVELFIRLDALCHHDIDNIPLWIDEYSHSKSFSAYYLYFEMVRKLYKYQNGHLELILTISPDTEDKLEEVAVGRLD